MPSRCLTVRSRSSWPSLCPRCPAWPSCAFLWPPVWVCSVARDLCLLSCLPILPAVRAAGVALGVALVLLDVGLALGLELGAVVGVGLMPVAIVDGCARGLILPVLLRCCLRPGKFHPWEAAAVLGCSGGRVGLLSVQPVEGCHALGDQALDRGLQVWGRVIGRGQRHGDLLGAHGLCVAEP